MQKEIAKQNLGLVSLKNTSTSKHAPNTLDTVGHHAYICDRYDNKGKVSCIFTLKTCDI